jgi:hypothetical protein
VAPRRSVHPTDARRPKPGDRRPKASSPALWPRLILIAAAIGCALAPWPAASVDRLYSRGIYATFQPVLTSLSSLIPIAWLDALIVVVVAWLVIRSIAIVRAASAARPRLVLQSGLDLIAGASLLYLLFLALWGLNYRRLPITSRLDHSASRVTPEATEALGRHSVDRLNQLYARAHADKTATMSVAAVRARLAPSFANAQRALGATRLAAAGRPKYSMLSPFFRWATVDGMVNPFGLEVLINPDLLPIERPFAVAHEWGHLAGWARESEASYLGWLTCLEGDDAAQYSAWLDLYFHVGRAVPRDRLARLDAALGPGPRADLSAIRQRIERGQPFVQAVSWRTYNQFLKANRVPEGLKSYDEVVALVLGTATDSTGRPRLR